MTLTGIVLCLYALVIVLNTWRLIYNENKEKNLLDITNVYVNAFLFGSIVGDVIIAGVFLIISKKSYEEYAVHRVNYIDFHHNLEELTKFKLELSPPTSDDLWSEIQAFMEDIFFIRSKKLISFNSQENSRLIEESVMKLESFFYTKYQSFIMSSVYLCCIAVLTFFFIIMEIF